MTGHPADTSRKFTFSSLRWWGLALLPLGGLWAHAFLGVVERRATGRLPLTRASDRKLRRAGWQGLLLILLGLFSFAGIFVFGIAIGPRAFSGLEATIAGIVWLAGLVSLIGGTVYLLIARYLVGPRGAVRRRLPGDQERMVEIWNLHPAFVIAFRQQAGSP